MLKMDKDNRQQIRLVLGFFGSVAKLADKLGIVRHAIYMWDPIPEARAYQIEVLSKGKIKANLLIGSSFKNFFKHNK